VNATALGARLEAAMSQWHHAEAIADDPLAWARRYADPLDREIAGLVAATVAFGRVQQIMENAGRALLPMGERPSVWLRDSGDRALRRCFAGWRHRWATGDELAQLLRAARDVALTWGSLGAAWSAVRRAEDLDTHDTLRRWVELFDARGLSRDNSLIPRPDRESACKRLHLYLRWMIRCDDVDPGGWSDDPARLLYPLDTHIHRFALRNGLTRRRAADLRTAREITAQFRRIDPRDPVRYDFAVVRSEIARGPENLLARRAQV
jgi:uncharacterized protein (TIGR02757 family)